MPGNDFTTVAQVRPLLLLQPGADITEDQALLQTLCTGVCEEFRSVLNRDLNLANYVETRDGSGTNMLTFQNYPVTAVATVQVGPGPQLMKTLATTDYVWTRTAVKLRFGIFAQGVGNVILTYSAGFATMPADLVLAASKTVAYRYRQLTRLGQNSKNMGQETVQFETGQYTKDVQNVLNQYRQVVPV